MNCTCGVNEPHVIARSESFDGVWLQLWSDGDITGRLGQFPPGLGKSRNKEKALHAARVVWGNICLYNWSEISGQVIAARKTFGG